MIRINTSVLGWLLFSLALTTSVPALAAGQKGDWHFLGERVVSDRAEYDTIQIGDSEGRFRKLKLGVQDAPIEIKRVVIHFGDGSRQTVERNILVGEKQKSPTLDLDGERRLISKVVFYYEARSRGWEKGTIRMYGRR